MEEKYPTRPPVGRICYYNQMNETLSPESEPTEEEIKQAAATLRRLPPGRLPLDVFIEVVRLVPAPIVEVVPVRKNSNGETEILLTKREETDPIWPGMLHTPGTVILASDKGENNEEAFMRIQKELGGVETSEPHFVKNTFHEVKRGKEQAQVYWAEVTGAPVVGEFYSAAQLPDTLVDTQVDFIKAAVSNFEASV